jgi:GTP-binding protein
MGDLLDGIKYLKSETDPSRLGACAAEVAFVGRSNVGKSSLLNAVCRRDLARVSSTPGRTRTINVFAAAADRWLVDLPGYGFAAGPEAEREAWAGMIEGYLSGRPSLRMVFSLIDAKVGPTKLDLRMLDWLEAADLPWCVVATKSDQVKPSRSAAQRRDVAHALGLQPGEVGWVSSLKGDGVRELRGAVCSLLAAP